MTAATTILSPDELRELLDDLLGRWEEHAGDFTGRKGTREDQLLVTFALAAHTHQLASTVLLLHEHERYLESIPLVRAAFEHALTAQWLAQYPDAIHGFINETFRQQRNLLTTIQATGWEKAADALEELNEVTRTAHPADQAARNMEQLCKDLDPAGEQAYAMYKILCSYTHAGHKVVDCYIQLDPVQAYTYPAHYTESDGTVWLFFVCASVMWSARAFDILEQGSPRSKDLRKVAAQLGVPAQFQLSPAFRQREQAYRRRQWKTPSR